jgi:hypothetical protein
VCLRTSQVFFSSIALVTDRFLVERALNGYGEVASAVGLNTIGGAFQDKLSGGFAFKVLNQKNEGDILFHPSEQLLYLGLVPGGVGIFGYDYIKRDRPEFFCKLPGSSGDGRCGWQPRPLQFIQATLNVCPRAMNKENSHQIPPVLQSVAGQSSFISSHARW